MYLQFSETTLTNTFGIVSCHKSQSFQTYSQTLSIYSASAPQYYRGAKAAIVVYDITSMSSFERARAWVSELQQTGSLNMVIGLAGNKCDMNTHREVQDDVAREYADSNQLLFFETSVSTYLLDTSRQPMIIFPGSWEQFACPFSSYIYLVWR
jgi:GTPase SAR1 family protein